MAARDKLLIIVRQQFWISSKGSSVRIRQLIAQLSHEYQIDIFHLRTLKPADMRALRACSPEINLIFSPSSTPAFWVDYVRAVFSSFRHPIDHERPSGIQPAGVKEWQISHLLRRVLSIETYDVTLFEYLWTAKFINPVTVPKLPLERWVDTHDVMHQRHESSLKAGIKNNRPIDAVTEKLYLSFFSKIIAIQAEEAAIFARMMPEKEIVTIPITLTVDATSEVEPPSGFFADDLNVLHVSSSDSIAIESMRWFLDQVWPSIFKRCPRARLHLVGSIGKAFQDKKDLSVTVHGFVDDLKPYYQHCTLSINPCLAGSGVKVKTLEALAYGKIVVTTEFGGQGLEREKTPRLVVASPDAYADAVIAHLNG